MGVRSLLVFDLAGTRYGVDATRVRETVWLPELTPIEEAPPWIVGLFSLRGRIVPVADLDQRFGHVARRRQPTDQIVVLETDVALLGLIVDSVIDVVEISAAAIQPPPCFDAAPNGAVHLVTGEARVGEDLVTLLDVVPLAHASPAPDEMHVDGIPAPAGTMTDAHFCPQATPAEHALFHARALALREVAIDESGARRGLAVVEMGGERFGVDLAAVREFCDIDRASPIPCCPPHILGVMSLRGEFVTLIDPRAALGLPADGQGGGKAMVTRLDGRAVGVVVDEVHDVLYLRDADMEAPPPLLRERHGTEITGTASRGGRTMIVLDLPALLARPEWIVDATV